MPDHDRRGEGYIGPPQDPMRGWRLAWNKEPRFAGVDLDEALERHHRDEELREHRPRRWWQRRRRVRP
jgi:hypothetical protein